MKNKSERNFDEIIDRSGTGSMKWEPSVLRAKFGSGGEDLLPLWVADMDFNSPPAVVAAMEKRLAHPVYGYTIKDPDYNEALIAWYRRRHNWDIKNGSIMTCPGIVPATNYIVQRFSKPGDRILIQTPVYYPFARSIIVNGRGVADNPLKIVNGRYEMDFHDLEEKAKDPRVKIAILCSPHNPVGRVWTRDELTEFGRICINNNLVVFADEIHCDLLMPGFNHIPFQSISEDFAHNSIAANSGSKTFNLAGLNQSNLIVPSDSIRNELSIYFETLGMPSMGSGTLFGAIATQAAYIGAEEWLDDLLLYLHKNYTYLKTELEGCLPGVKVADLEGTYLAWVDLRPLGLPPESITQKIEQTARVALDHGEWFGKNGEGFQRINLACPRSILERAVNAMVVALKSPS